MDISVIKTSYKSLFSKRAEHSFNGTILIPDISGFTKFVTETEFAVGQEITRQLLEVILRNNILNLKISEIEGDAVLFYKKKAISLKQIQKQFERMLGKFEEKVKELRREYDIEIDLSLKMIVHYGELSTYIIGRFEKLYGRAVIEAHNLLKNSISSASYLLFTQSVYQENKKEVDSACNSGSQLCEVYGNLEKIGYSYLIYEEDPSIETISPSNDLPEYSLQLNLGASSI